MKRLMITAMALSMMAAPAFADGTITGGGLNVGLGSAQTGTNGNAINEISISGSTGSINNNGAYSTNFGALNTGPVANITNFSSSYVEAPTFDVGPAERQALARPSGDISLTTVSSAAVGATTVYETGFRPKITTLAVDYEDRSSVDVDAIVVVVGRRADIPSRF